MKKKRRVRISKKKYKKISKPWRRLIYSFFMIIGLVSTYLFFKAYHYINDIPDAQNITQEEIYRLTRIEETDTRLIRALKNNAFESWLYEANDEKVKQLSKNETLLLDVMDGNIDVSDIDATMENIKKHIDIIEDVDVEELYILYYKKVLPKQYDELQNTFQESTVKNAEEMSKDAQKLLDLLNKIYNQEGMLAVTDEQSFKQSVSLLDEINDNIIEANKIKDRVSSYTNLVEAIPTPSTKFGMELGDYVDMANSYLQSKTMVAEFKRKYSELQSNLESNEKLIKRSVNIPDLVGMTVREAKQAVDQLNLNLSIQGYTNEKYKNRDRVPESLRDIETWDGDEQDTILKQEPSSPAYKFIVKGSTIQIIVENQPVEKKTTPSESSSSSTTSSSTTSETTSSSTDETTSSSD
ncbi:PASTA domain-containing protein [Vagococcus sp. JNUCC 83]